MTYREGRDPREVALEVFTEAQDATARSEMAYQNAIAEHLIAGQKVEVARVKLGHLVEIERHRRTLLGLSKSPVSEGEGEDVTRAREEVTAAEERLEQARREVETRYDQKAEAAKRLREAKAEVDRLG